MKNYGIDWEREKREQDGTEEQLGATPTPCIVSIPVSDYKKYLPKGEPQNIGEEKMDCASRAPLNILETKLNYRYQNNHLFSENRKWLEDNGYVVNGQIELSDAFTAILSGTTRQGNSLKAPLQAIHEYGVVPKKLLPQGNSFNEHHDPARITQALKDLGLEFIKRFPIRYRQVQDYSFSQTLKEIALDVAGYAWTNPINGVYPSAELQPNHAFMIFPPVLYEAFDNYTDSFDGDFIKRLSEDYDFMEYGYELYILSENLLGKTKDLTFWQKLWAFIKRLFMLK